MTISNNKLLIGASGGGSDPINVEDVFSVFLYEGNGGTQTFNNGIDIDGEGGLVWIKNRDATDNHVLTDTVRGATKIIYANQTEEATDDDTITAFNSTGFALGDDVKVNTNNESYCAWTWRKAPKFFDIVTYTGSGSAQNISHNLESVPGMFMIKERGGDENWRVYHRGFEDGDYYLNLGAEGSVTLDNFNRHFNGTDPTSSVFTVGTDNSTNGSNKTYVAYLFAHNNNDGTFGPDGDQDIIKCGSYTYSNGLEIDLGFEPQFLIYKPLGTGHWRMVDNMRGWGIPSSERFLYPSLTNAEAAGGQLDLTNTGFRVHDAGTGDYIYMAIRRSPMAEPESATDVFDVGLGEASGTPAFVSSFPPDFAMFKYLTGDNWYISSRLQQGKTLYANYNNLGPEISDSGSVWDYQNGYYNATLGTSWVGYLWKRAPKFCDVITYKGNGTAGRTVAHNLEVVPEMMWVKRREADEYAGQGLWAVYHAGMHSSPEEKFMRFDNNALGDSTAYWNDTAPTASVFSVGNANSDTNDANVGFVAYIFATLAGISKVGNYTGTGSDQTIDCGFSNGARFVLLKATGTSSNWLLFDTARGISASSAAFFRLDTNAAQQTVSTIRIAPANSGFIAKGSYDWVNADGENYIFYAIA